MYIYNRIWTDVLEAANEPTRFAKDENDLHILLEYVFPIIWNHVLELRIFFFVFIINFMIAIFFRVVFICEYQYVF